MIILWILGIAISVCCVIMIYLIYRQMQRELRSKQDEIDFARREIQDLREYIDVMFERDENEEHEDAVISLALDIYLANPKGHGSVMEYQHLQEAWTMAHGLLTDLHRIHEVNHKNRSHEKNY